MSSGGAPSPRRFLQDLRQALPSAFDDVFASRSSRAVCRASFSFFSSAEVFGNGCAWAVDAARVPCYACASPRGHPRKPGIRLVGSHILRGVNTEGFRELSLICGG